MFGLFLASRKKNRKKKKKDALAMQMISRAVCPAHTRQDALGISLPFILI